MNFNKLNIESGSAISLGLSLAFHFVAFISIAIIINISQQNIINSSGYISLNTQLANFPSKSSSAKDIQNRSLGKLNKTDKIELSEKSSYYNFVASKIDTNKLSQIYSEKTLNVSIKYPAGWVFLDQDIKNKLDGVTFWATQVSFSPPPYVHLDVQEKYMFNPKKYKYQKELNNAIAFFDEPEEMENQVSQDFYIRTNSDEDFSIRLIVQGAENFKIFQPEFFGMIKSFKFGSSWF